LPCFHIPKNIRFGECINTSMISILTIPLPNPPPTSPQMVKIQSFEKFAMIPHP
jgi:hypothetical protein